MNELTDLELQNKIHKNYSEKILSKIPIDAIAKATDINELVVLLNYCFQKKNDFFVSNFNRRNVRNIYLAYNQLKTNILTANIDFIFFSIDNDNLKLLRFLVINFVNNYSSIDENNKELRSWVSKESMKRCLQYLNTLIK